MTIEVAKNKVRYLTSQDLHHIAHWIQKHLQNNPPSETYDFLEIISAGYENEVDITWEKLQSLERTYVYLVTKTTYFQKNHWYGYIIKVSPTEQEIVLQNNQQKLIKISDLKDIQRLIVTDPI